MARRITGQPSDGIIQDDHFVIENMGHERNRPGNVTVEEGTGLKDVGVFVRRDRRGLKNLFADPVGNNSGQYGQANFNTG